MEVLFVDSHSIAASLGMHVPHFAGYDKGLLMLSSFWSTKSIALFLPVLSSFLAAITIQVSELLHLNLNGHKVLCQLSFRAGRELHLCTVPGLKFICLYHGS